MSGRRNFRELRSRIEEDPRRRTRLEQYERAIRDALALADLRDARGVSQRELASTLNVSQANVSRVEHEEDIYLSTLRSYIAALGGELEVSAVFPDEKVTLSIPAAKKSA